MVPIGGHPESPNCAAAAQAVEAVLHGRLQWMALRALVVAVRHADAKLRRRDLARFCECTERTLQRRLRAAGAGTPMQVIAWGRILAISYLLDHRSTLEDAAASLHMDGSAALVHLFRRHAGLTPGAVRAAGGMATAIDILGAQVAARLGPAETTPPGDDARSRRIDKTFWPSRSESVPGRQRVARRDSARTPV